MGGLTAFTGARLTFLQGQRERFAHAATTRTITTFMDVLYDQYFRYFPETTPHNEDPTPEAMAAVDLSSDEDPHPPPVRKPGQSAKDFEEEMEAYKELETRILNRMKQILRWMRYHSKNGLLEAHVLYLNKLAGLNKSEKPGRRSSAYNLWYKHKENFLDKAIEDTFKEKKATFEKKCQEAGGTLTDGDGKVLKAPAWVAVRQDMVKAAFDQLPKDDQQKWQSKAEQDHTQRLEKWANTKELHFSTDPDDRQRSIDLLHSWVMPLLEGIQGLTGLNVSLFCSGPIPADQGNIHVLGMHCGRTIANPCETFGSKYQDQLRLRLYPLLADFCAQTHTLDECRWSSLGADAKLGKFFETDEVHLDPLGSDDRARFIAMSTSSDTGGKASSSTAKATVLTSASSSSTSSSKSTVDASSSAANPAVSSSVSSSSAANSKSITKASSSAAKPVASSSTSTPSTSNPKSTTTASSSAANPAVSSSVSSSSTANSKSITKASSSAAKPASSSTSTPSTSNPKGTTDASSLAANPAALGIASTSSTANSKKKLGASSSTAKPAVSNSASPAMAVPNLSTAKTPSNAGRRANPRPPPVLSASSLQRDKEGGAGHRVSVGGGASVSTVQGASNASRHPPAVLPASSLRVHKGGTAGQRVLPVGGGSTVSKSQGPSMPNYPSKINVTGLQAGYKAKTGQPSKGRTFAVSSPSQNAGGAANPIVLFSSPAAPTTSAKRRRISSPISISSTGSSPIPSPTRKARRMSSPSPSPSERTATPHPPVRPDAVRASSPPQSSQPRLSLTPPPSTQPRGTKRTFPVTVDVKNEPESPASCTSMDEISLALAADAGSSPVKSVGGETSSSSQALASAIEDGMGNEKGKGKGKEYIVCLPEDCEAYMVKTMELCSRVAAGNQEELWVELAAAYVALEVVRNYKPGKLNTDGRPEVVALWIKHARSPRYRPAIKLKAFKLAFQAWWWNIAPDWRRTDGADAVLLHGDGDWTVLYDSSTGPNGMSSVMAALAWWLDVVEGLPTRNPRERQVKEEEQEEWVESARDVLWSYNEMLKL
ncbi:SERTA domain-containing protein 3 [Marasmius crinis-equi]|uniref:SERTA domain-containing protein 3 n=1 Tax=Marasmius crinis-equi TaxID=585013 RepID=A0ABR3F002_9AGAR